MSKNKIIIAFGTRPELIKLAPVIDQFKKHGQRNKLFLVHTAQHHQLSKPDLDYFGIDIDYQFKLERENDSLSLLNGLLLLAFHKLLVYLKENEIHPSALIALGDTCSAFVSGQFAFYEKIPFLHIEAGLRTGDFSEPFPEEYFRKSMASMASLHFAPTTSAAQNLLSEQISPDTILITGNTVIDHLREISENMDIERDNAGKKIVLITIHRRENILYKLDFIRQKIVNYCLIHPEKQFLWIDNPGYKITSGIAPRPANLEVINAVCFTEMLTYYRSAELIITDSGGMQEEACYLNIPALIFRAKTERMESIDSGPAKYFEDDPDLNTVIAKLKQQTNEASKVLFGEGTASKKIYDAIIDWELTNNSSTNI